VVTVILGAEIYIISQDRSIMKVNIKKTGGLKGMITIFRHVCKENGIEWMKILNLMVNKGSTYIWMVNKEFAQCFKRPPKARTE
jgi:hypothetical protein